MTGKEKTKLLNEVLVPIFFPYAKGNVLFDVVTKRKAMLVEEKKEFGRDGNPKHFRILYITILYDGEETYRKISRDTFHKRFLPMEQILSLWPDYEKYSDSWITRFVSGPKPK